MTKLTQRKQLTPNKQISFGEKNENNSFFKKLFVYLCSLRDRMRKNMNFMNVENYYEGR